MSKPLVSMAQLNVLANVQLSPPGISLTANEDQSLRQIACGEASLAERHRRRQIYMYHQLGNHASARPWFIFRQRITDSSSRQDKIVLSFSQKKSKECATKIST
jgi:hypothetical protein